MPNLIHYLDASTIALLNTHTKNYHNITDMYTIHSCFGVTDNNVDSLIYKIKIFFLIIYYENNYLINLDNGIKNTLKQYFG